MKRKTKIKMILKMKKKGQKICVLNQQNENVCNFGFTLTYLSN